MDEALVWRREPRLGLDLVEGGDPVDRLARGR